MNYKSSGKRFLEAFIPDRNASELQQLTAPFAASANGSF